ncbi:MAG: hypothetical protein Q8L48_44240 [Archangium sp.]|nr:hypothetical protein [Archangium sp.]
MKKLILGMCVAAGLLSCGPSDPDLTCDTSPPAATLATNVQAVFDTKCKTCHIADYSYGDYTTAAKTAAIVGKKSLYAGTGATLLVVDPKSLANSALWLKVLGGSMSGRTGPKGENVYAKMPNDNSIVLSADEKKLLKDWICGGAK